MGRRYSVSHSILSLQLAELRDYPHACQDCISLPCDAIPYARYGSVAGVGYSQWDSPFVRRKSVRLRMGTAE